MVWSNGWMLGIGGALVLVPVILHLLMQPKPKKLVFPALRFLQERQRQNRSRLRLRHVLLLLVRCLLIGLLVLALAGPTVASREYGNWLTLGGIAISGLVVGLILVAAWLQTKKNWLLIGILGLFFLGHLGLAGWSATTLLNSESSIGLGDSQAPVAALIVIDSSPRMDYRFENRTRLEAAQEMASWLIRQFPPDSQVAVATNNQDRPFFSVDLSAANRRVETLGINFLERPLPDVLLDGLELLNSATEERKEIYLVSDLTRRGWASDQIRPLYRRLEAAKEISLFVIDVGVDSPQNFSLGDLRLSNANLSTNALFAIETNIHRVGGAAQKVVRLKIEQPDPSRPVVRDGVALFPSEVLEEQTQTVELRENSSRPLSFVGTVQLEKGTYHGTIEIDGQDNLAVDDIRHFTLRVQDPWQVLIVHPDNVSPRSLVSTLAPSQAVQAGRSNYYCDIIGQSELEDRTDLGRYAAVFLLNPQPLTVEAWELLHGYVARGGGLGVMLGHNAGRQGFADPSFQSPLAQELLSGQLDLIWDASEEGLSMRPQELSHPLFKMLRPYAENILWNRVPVYLYWEIEPDDQAANLPTQVLMRYTNGAPALIERNVGQGRVLIMTTPITERANESGRRVWNDLYDMASFVPWFLYQMITEYLVQPDADSLNVRVGQIASFQNDLGQYPESYQVFSPIADKPPSRLAAIDHSIKYRFTEVPGHFRLRGSFDGQPKLRGFSVSLPEAMTDLSRIDPIELDDYFGANRYQLARNFDEIQRQQGTSRKGREFYSLLVLMMLVFFALEYLMSNRFYASR